jgi:hypothetical protein
MNSGNSRRAFICASSAIGAGFVLSACGGENKSKPGQQASESGPKKDEKEEGGEVTATEDLMREHGVLRRALLVYTAAAGYVTNVHFLKFDLIKPISHLRASRRPKAL